MFLGKDGIIRLEPDDRTTNEGKTEVQMHLICVSCASHAVYFHLYVPVHPGFEDVLEPSQCCRTFAKLLDVYSIR